MKMEDIMFDQLKNQKRLLMEAELQPVQGQRFQPTGFADLGAAMYQGPDGGSMLLVESAQSMANRFEAAILNPENELIAELEGLSYVRVQLSGDSEAKTNSLVEAHRLNSPFIITDKEFQEKFTKEADYAKGKPLDWRKIAAAIFKYDLNSLLHGIFLANLVDGRVKTPRALSAFIEAEDVREAVSGGVKNNPIDPTGTIRAVDHDKDVYGNVPYQRVEYTAGKIKAYINFDLGLLSSYELGRDPFDLLVGLGLYKIQRFLKTGLRLRTACDLGLVSGLLVTEPGGFDIPSEEDLLPFIQKKIKAVQGQLAQPPVTELTKEVKLKKKKD